MTAEELLALRREAASFLARLQQLGDFRARRAALPQLPAAAAELRWEHIDAICRKGSAAVVGWRYGPAKENPELAQELREQLPDALIRGERGEEIIRIPQRVEIPAGITGLEEKRAREFRDGLLAYWEGANRFARLFLLDVDWAPQAVHLAIVHDDAVRLPPPPPGRLMVIPGEVSATITPGEPIDEGYLVGLIELLMLAEPYGTNESGAPTPRRQLGTRGRTRTWESALRAVGKRLKEPPKALTITERGSLRRARRYLEATATGRLPPA